MKPRSDQPPRAASGPESAAAGAASQGDSRGGESLLPAALAGRRVLELADEKGMYAGKLLADMGADVIKIERPGGDPARAIPPRPTLPPDADAGLYFLYQNTNKRGITLDLDDADGRALYLRLAATADLIIETFAPGRLDAAGLGYSALVRRKPDIVLTSVTHFGQSGPRRALHGSDLVDAALGGSLYVIGDPRDAPVTLAGWQSYAMASTYAACASMIALLHASACGRGQHIDISVQETTASVAHICGVGKYLDDGIIPKRFGTGLFASVPSGAYRCRDGLVYLMVNRPAHWQALARWIHETTGNREVLDPMFDGPSSNRQPYRELLDLFIGEMTAAMTVDEVYHEGQRRHIAFTPVNTMTRVASDPHLAARGFFVDVDCAGAGPLTMPGAPYRHARTPWRIRHGAPQAGEHNEEIFCGELGLPSAELAALGKRGIV